MDNISPLYKDEEPPPLLTADIGSVEMQPPFMEDDPEVVEGRGINQFQELSKGFSLIPLHNKPIKGKPELEYWKAPIEKAWNKWCEIKKPFQSSDFKNRNVGIACGPASGILVIDVDDVVKFNKMAKANGWAEDMPMTRTHETATGKPHFIYAYPKNGKRYGNRSFKDPDGEIDSRTGKVKTVFDIRGLGGQVVAPGSINPDTGKRYTIRHDIPIAPAPKWLLDLALHNEQPQSQPKQASSFDGNLQGLQVPYAVRRLIEGGEVKGKRSEAIMSVLNALVMKAKLSDKAIIDLFESYPIGEKYREKGDTREKWLLQQVEKVKASNNNDGLTAKLKLWVDQAPGTFPIRDIKEEFHIFDEKSMNTLYVSLHRLEKERIIEKEGTKRGVYRRIEKDVQIMDFLNVNGNNVDLWLPFGIDKLVRLYPGNIILLAGEIESGKTALMLNIIKENMKTWKVHYFNSEMGEVELRERLLLFDDIKLEDWKFRPIEHNDNFHDVIVPGEGNLNIIDYVELVKDFYLVGGEISKIHKRLEGAIAIVAIQKNPGVDHGLGGWRSYEKPRLALNISRGEIEIVKCKNYIGKHSPRGRKFQFKIVNGCRLENE